MRGKPAAHLLARPISGPLAAARSACGRPLIGLRDVPMEFYRLRSRSAYQAPSSRLPSGFVPLDRLSRNIAENRNFRSQPTAAHLPALWA